MRTALVMLTLVLCLGMLAISIYETADSPEGRDNPVRRLFSSLAGCFREEKPVIILEEEVEVVKYVPRGVDMGGRSNSTLPEAKPATRPPEFFEEPVRHQAQPVILLEEEVEITRDVPSGTSFDNFSQRNLDSTSCLDAYGLRPVVKRPVVEP